MVGKPESIQKRAFGKRSTRFYHAGKSQLSIAESAALDRIAFA